MLTAILALRHFRYVDSTCSRCKHDTHGSHSISVKESRQNIGGGDVIFILEMKVYLVMTVYRRLISYLQIVDELLADLIMAMRRSAADAN